MKSLLFFPGFFVVAILLASCGSGGGSSGPAALKLSVAASTGNETAGVTFSLTLNRKSARDISFKYRIEAGTAEQEDFASTVQLDTELERTIVAKNSTLDIVIEIDDDKLVEAAENFSLILSDVTGATFDPAGDTLTATGTITDDDFPSLSVAASTGNETDDVIFSLTLDQDPIDAVSFKYRIEAGTAEPADFASTVQLDTELEGTIAIGERTKDIVIDIENDELVEAAENFSLILSDVTGATFDPAGDTLTARGTITSDYADADGNGLLEIGTPAEMNNIRYNLAGTSYKTSSTDMGDASNCPAVGCNGYELVDNIDLVSFADWMPIQGEYSTSITTSDACVNDNSGVWDGVKCILPAAFFSAIFDGKDNTISNLTVGSSTGVAGLFGSVSGTIRDLRLVGGSITGEARTGAVAGNLVSGGIVENVSSDLAISVSVSVSSGVNVYAGGLVGYNSGTIRDSNATGAVTGGAGIDRMGGLVGSNGGTIQDSNATGAVTGGAGNDRLGGLAGSNSNDGTIRDSNATGAVTGDAGADRLGGLVGSSNGIIQNSYATTGVVNGGADNDWVGGLLGNNYKSGNFFGSILNSYATSAVTGGANDDYVGGLVGYSSGVVQNSYYAGVATVAVTGGAGTDSVGGLVGYSDGNNILNSNAIGAINGGAGNDWVGGLVGLAYESSIRNSYASGASTGEAGIDFVGGLVGRNSDGTIHDSYATGTAGGDAGAGDNVGGLVGLSYGIGDTSLIWNSYALGAVTGTVTGGADDNDYVGRVIGRVRGTSDIFGNYALSSSTLTGEIKRTIGTDEVKEKDASGLKALTAAITETDFTSTDTTDGWSTNNWDFTAEKYPSLKSYKVESGAQVEGDLLCTQGVDWNLGDEWVQC